MTDSMPTIVEATVAEPIVETEASDSETRATPPQLHYHRNDDALISPEPSAAEIRRQQERRYHIAIGIAYGKRERGEPLDMDDRRALWSERVNNFTSDAVTSLEADDLLPPLRRLMIEIAEVALAYTAANEKLKARTVALEQSNAALIARVDNLIRAAARSEPPAKMRVRVQAPSQRHQQHHHSTAPASMPNDAGERAAQPSEHALAAPRINARETGQ